MTSSHLWALVLDSFNFSDWYDVLEEMVRSEEDVITLDEDLIKQRQADVNTVKAEDLLNQLNNNLAERKANYLILKTDYI